MLIDAHAHLDFYTPEDLPRVLAMIRDRGILTVANSVSLDSWRKTQQVAALCDLVIPSFGLHPVWGATDLPSTSDLERALEDAPMIGEIGLDYTRATTSERRAQRRTFEQVLHLARDNEKVVTIHSKGAERDVLESLDRVQPTRAILHWYQGPTDVLQELIDRGAFFSIGFAVLDTPAVRDLVRRLPLPQLLTETDNPAARSLRGREAMPDLVCEVVEETARLKGIEAGTLEEVVEENFRRLVGERLAARVDRASGNPLQGGSGGLQAR
ncbi:MAG: TatD family hydrolase [Actinobacteria bacterium]|nr:TatD family hydrolase [Actinomycetota bacterium]